MIYHTAQTAFHSKAKLDLNSTDKDHSAPLKQYTPSTQHNMIRPTITSQNLYDDFAILLFQIFQSVAATTPRPPWTMSNGHASTILLRWDCLLIFRICIQNVKYLVRRRKYLVSLIETWERGACSHMLQSTLSSNTQNVKRKRFFESYSDFIPIKNTLISKSLFNVQPRSSRPHCISWQRCPQFLVLSTWF